MAFDTLGLGVVFEAKDLATGVMDRVASKFVEVEGASSKAAQAVKANLRSFSTGMALLGGGAATLGLAVTAANISGKFNKELAAAGAVAGATAQELKLFENAALDAGLATKFSPTQAAKALGDIAQAGYSATESTKALLPVLQLAEGSLGKLDPSGAAGLATQTLKAFGLSVDEATPTVDKLLKTVNLFALSADDLPLALGTAARGAGVMKQSLDETLVALGLVKNIIPGTERASTAVAVAMERMVNPEVANKLKEQGVAVADAEGNFRPFLDVVLDMTGALNKMGTEQKRAAFLVETFGAEALGGLQAILTQVNSGLRTSSGEFVKGASAVDYLRKSITQSKGAAAEFSSALLNTFEGQKELIAGSLETLAIVVGQPFERALAPLVKTFLTVLNEFLAAMRALPNPVKDVLAKGVLLAGTIMTLLGGALAAKAAFGLFSAGLSAAGVTVGGFLATLAPAVGILALVTLAVVGLREAVDRNIGGVGDTFAATAATVKLAWDALSQLFEQGGFSGAVLDEFNKAGNEGIEAFAIRVYTFASRVIEFFSQIGSGFSSVLGALGPTIEGLKVAFSDLAETFGFVSEAIDTQATGASFDAFGAAGVRVGEALGNVFGFFVEVLTGVVRLVNGIIAYAGALGRTLAPVLDVLRPIGVTLAGMFETTGAGTNVVDALANVMQALGNIVIYVAEIAVPPLQVALSIVGDVIKTVLRVAGGLIDFLAGVFTLDWTRIWTGIAKIVHGAFSVIVTIVGSVVEAIAGVMDTLARVFGFTNTNAAASVRSFFDAVDKEFAVNFGEVQRPGAVDPAPVGGISDAQSFLAPEPVSPLAPGLLQSGQESAAATSSLAAAAQELRASKEGATLVNATLMVDQEALGRIITNVARGDAAQSFTPVPVEE